MALQTTFGALFYNPWGFLVLLLGGAIPATIVFFNEKYHEGETKRVECLAKMLLLKQPDKSDQFKHCHISQITMSWVETQAQPSTDSQCYVIKNEQK